MHRCTKWKRANPEANRAHARKWFRSFEGRIAGAYSGMKQRVEGRGQVKTRHLYKGLPLLARDEFVGWSRESLTYRELYAAWVAEGHPLKLTPSIDRIDSSQGYLLENMRWITYGENSARAARLRWRKA